MIRRLWRYVVCGYAQSVHLSCATVPRGRGGVLQIIVGEGGGQKANMRSGALDHVEIRWGYQKTALQCWRDGTGWKGMWRITTTTVQL